MNNFISLLGQVHWPWLLRTFCYYGYTCPPFIHSLPLALHVLQVSSGEEVKTSTLWWFCMQDGQTLSVVHLLSQQHFYDVTHVFASPVCIPMCGKPTYLRMILKWGIIILFIFVVAVGVLDPSLPQYRVVEDLGGGLYPYTILCSRRLRWATSPFFKYYANQPGFLLGGHSPPIESWPPPPWG